MKQFRSLFSFVLTFLVAFVVTTLCVHAFAAPSPLPSSLPALDGVTAAIPTSGTVVMVVSTILGFLVELVARKFPTSSPQGWLVWLGSLFGLVAGLGGQIQALCNKAHDFLNAVIPQNLKS